MSAVGPRGGARRNSVHDSSTHGHKSRSAVALARVTFPLCCRVTRVRGDNRKCFTTAEASINSSGGAAGAVDVSRTRVGGRKTCSSPRARAVLASLV